MQRMQTLVPVLGILAGLCAPGAALGQGGDELPFVGRWNCEVAEFAFTDTTYDNGAEVLPIREVQEGTDGSYTLFFDNDYMITLSGFTGDEMGWFSHESGDNFACTRLAD
ncbi:hypothetical protein [Antarcticirhabdus aurantiaca]|uniref:Uncharacterized protein n=1 Tax=Antarcticirhabdus aurantiaca TaxID=2606717 RepID=A0ACD4NK22_9HYPH|nr:hypothetical protein [Antarcticirhabdus aurantiaca]WAJ27189.1 hypothetical protein OXU80_20365 [Jeongeuplla avenae]